MDIKVGPKTIGLFIENRNNSYNETMIAGAEAAIRESDYRLVLFSETLQEYDSTRKDQNPVPAALAIAVGIDGCIYPASVFSPYTSKGKLKDFVSYLDPNKTLILEADVPGFHCLTKDNRPLIRELLDYLLEEKNCGSFLFVNSTTEDYDALEREKAVIEVLAEHGIELKEEQILHTSFKGEKDKEIADFLERHPTPDVLLFINDNLAFSAINAVRSLGLIPGADVYITGFDDQPESSNCNPPLTTIRCGGFMMGYHAVKKLIGILEKNDATPHILRGKVIHRLSAGEEEADIVASFRSLIAKRPYPVDEIAKIIQEKCIIVDSRADNLYRVILSEVKTLFRLFEGKVGAGSHPILGMRDRAAPLIKAGTAGTIYLWDFEWYFSCLLNAMILESTKGGQELLMQYLQRFHNELAYYFAGLGEQRRREFARHNNVVARLIHKIQEAAGSDFDKRAIFMRGMAELEFQEATWNLFRFPLRVGEGQKVVIPTSWYNYASIHHSKIHFTDPESATVSVSQLVPSFVRQHPEVTILHYLAIYPRDALVGVTLLSKNMSIDSFYNVTLQTSYAYNYLGLVDQERVKSAKLSSTNKTLKRASHHDALTGLLNRRGFLAETGKLGKCCYGHNAACFFLDLDDFKSVNDNYGHDEGDEALKAVGRIIKKVFQNETNITCRLGGDEFLVFAKVESEEKMEHLRDKIVRAFKKWNQEENKPYELNTSIGTSFFLLDKTIDLQEKINDADKALYIEKATHHALIDAKKGIIHR